MWKINWKKKKTFQKTRILLVPQVLVSLPVPFHLVIEAVTDAEILQMFDVISSNCSQNSCRNISELLAAMFKDNCSLFRVEASNVDMLLILGYLLSSNLFLAEALNDASHYVCCFKECYNYVIKKGQMDMHVRYWDKFESCSRDVKEANLSKYWFLFVCFCNVEVVIRGTIITKRR